MTAQEVIMKDINDGTYSNLVTAILIMAFWILGSISADEMVSDLALINYTYNSADKTFSDGTTTYTVYQLIDSCCKDVYPAKAELGKFTMNTIIDSATAENYITSEQATSLKAEV